jgi:hypothetical protein
MSRGSLVCTGWTKKKVPSTLICQIISLLYIQTRLKYIKSTGKELSKAPVVHQLGLDMAATTGDNVAEAFLSLTDDSLQCNRVDLPDFFLNALA